MIAVTVNGKPYEVPKGSTVADVVAQVCPSARGVAVAVDREVVPRSRWTDHLLEPGAAIEVVGAAAGG
jgi:sulfur carrier protein